MSSKNRKPMIIKENEEESSTLEELVDKQLEENPAVILKKVQVDTWLNVRSGPTPDGEIVGRLENGDIVEIFAVKDNFAKISETEDKWVNTDYLFPVYNV